MNNKTIAGVAVAVIVVVIACCAVYYFSNDDGPSGQDDVPSEPGQVPGGDDTPDDVRVLVAYFSKTGTTERYAEEIQGLTGADIVRIETTVPYPEDYTQTTEVALDELNSDARPEMSTFVVDMDQYDIVLIGYPVWWHAPPMAVLSFLEDYDLGGKTVVTFCTSASSPISETTGYIEGSIGDADLIEGIRMTPSTDIGQWLESVGVPLSA